MKNLTKPAQPTPAAGISGAERLFWRLVLAGALAITILRLAAPLQIGKDQAQQLEAGSRLAAGLGVTSTSSSLPTVPDITPVPETRPLTTWPPGLSVVIAGFTLCGVPLVVSLKLLCGGVTLAGWLGWANLCGRLLSELPGSRALRAVFFLAAFLLPILYTPLWSGTDIFLWACVPWVILLLARPGASPRPLLSAAVAGVLVGLSFWFRYAGAFLGVAGILILLYQLWPDWKALLTRSAVFGGLAALLAIPVIVFMRSSYVPLSDVYDAGLETGEFQRILSGSYHTIRVIFGMSLPETILARWNWQPVLYATGLFSIGAVLAAPGAAALRMEGRPRKSLVVPMLIVPAALLLFLAAVSRGFYLSVSRYYEPVQLCWIFAALSFLGGNGAAAWGSRLLAAAFAFNLLLVTPLRSVSPAGHAGTVRIVLGYSPSRATGINSTSAPVSFLDPGRLLTVRAATRDKILELYRAHPKALFWTENYPMYVYDGWPDGPTPGAGVRQLPALPALRSAYSSQERKLFVVLEDSSAAELADIEWPGQVVYRNTWEQTTIREVDLAPGQPVLRRRAVPAAALEKEAR